MPASVHQLPTPKALPLVQPDRGDWGALRAELHKRCADQDLAELWRDMAPGERRTLLASAAIPQADRDIRQAIEDMPKPRRDAIRAAIHRMSQYASRLRERMDGERKHPSRDLASHAREALAEGNTEGALHWISMIERGVA
ncbi:hypothetical protein HCU01_33660 [Halomonas cupida]|uniref:Uncharacterized protein n=1 Tax=Halomonas cupida TaxID=44933 RepID=A0A1M7KFP4_9GAMM|nr:hypothetical protein [Halomonas cupida]GEN25417.1 hypothetical protein HCU01_33660 [Halomonas cupida]SHM64152.1 hypothetical protein SAMN05660971_03487 [Halomonas cupida]